MKDKKEFLNQIFGILVFTALLALYLILEITYNGFKNAIYLIIDSILIVVSLILLTIFYLSNRNKVMYLPGNTKLKELKRIKKVYNLNENIRLFAKVENTNPSGSIKDRAVYNMLLDYKDRDILKENGLVIEATSGNTGISLAYFSKYMHYKALIVMPTSVSVQRREMISKYGGEVILVEGGMKECKEKVEELLKENSNAFEFNQFNNLYNPEAHFKSTGPEINKQCPNVNYIFAGIGTGGTISGIGNYFKTLRDKDPLPRIIGVEPLQSPLLTKGIANSHKIQGIGANFIPNTYLKDYVDEVIDVDDMESINTAKDIRNIEHIDVGISSGAALLGAINYIKENNITSGNFVIIFPDKGDRYTW